MGRVPHFNSLHSTQFSSPQLSHRSIPTIGSPRQLHQTHNGTNTIGDDKIDTKISPTLNPSPTHSFLLEPLEAISKHLGSPRALAHHLSNSKSPSGYLGSPRPTPRHGQLKSPRLVPRAEEHHLSLKHHPGYSSPPPEPLSFLDAKEKDLPFDGKFMLNEPSVFNAPLGLRREGELLMAVLTGVQGSSLERSTCDHYPGSDLLKSENGTDQDSTGLESTSVFRSSWHKYGTYKNGLLNYEKRSTSCKGNNMTKKIKLPLLNLQKEAVISGKDVGVDTKELEVMMHEEDEEECSWLFDSAREEAQYKQYLELEKHDGKKPISLEDYLLMVKKSMGRIGLQAQMLQDLQLGDDVDMGIPSSELPQMPPLEKMGTEVAQSHDPKRKATPLYQGAMRATSLVVKRIRRMAGLMHTEQQSVDLKDIYEWLTHLGAVATNLGKVGGMISAGGTMTTGSPTSSSVQENDSKAGGNGTKADWRLPSSPQEALLMAQADLKERLAYLYEEQDRIKNRKEQLEAAKRIVGQKLSSKEVKKLSGYLHGLENLENEYEGLGGRIARNVSDAKSLETQFKSLKDEEGSSTKEMQKRDKKTPRKRRPKRHGRDKDEDLEEQDDDDKPEDEDQESSAKERKQASGKGATKFQAKQGEKQQEGGDEKYKLVSRFKEYLKQKDDHGAAGSVEGKMGDDLQKDTDTSQSDEEGKGKPKTLGLRSASTRRKKSFNLFTSSEGTGNQGMSDRLDYGAYDSPTSERKHERRGSARGRKSGRGKEDGGRGRESEREMIEKESKKQLHSSRSSDEDKKEEQFPSTSGLRTSIPRPKVMKFDKSVQTSNSELLDLMDAMLSEMEEEDLQGEDPATTLRRLLRENKKMKIQLRFWRSRNWLENTSKHDSRTEHISSRSHASSPTGFYVSPNTAMDPPSSQDYRSPQLSSTPRRRPTSSGNLGVGSFDEPHDRTYPFVDMETLGANIDNRDKESEVGVRTSGQLQAIEPGSPYQSGANTPPVNPLLLKAGKTASELKTDANDISTDQAIVLNNLNRFHSAQPDHLVGPSEPSTSRFYDRDVPQSSQLDRNYKTLQTKTLQPLLPPQLSSAGPTPRNRWSSFQPLAARLSPSNAPTEQELPSLRELPGPTATQSARQATRSDEQDERRRPLLSPRKVLPRVDSSSLSESVNTLGSPLTRSTTGIGGPMSQPKSTPRSSKDAPLLSSIPRTSPRQRSPPQSSRLDHSNSVSNVSSTNSSRFSKPAPTPSWASHFTNEATGSLPPGLVIVGRSSTNT